MKSRTESSLRQNREFQTKKKDGKLETYHGLSAL